MNNFTLINLSSEMNKQIAGNHILPKLTQKNKQNISVLVKELESII